MSQPIEFTVVVETHTFDEGGDWERFRRSLHAAFAIAAAEGNAEVLVADVCGLPQWQNLISQEFPKIRKITAKGVGYDEVKMIAARAAKGHYVLYLDGDCIPEPGWHSYLLNALRNNKSGACGGYTRYDGGFMASILSVLDFGFLYPRISRELKCYASNNCGFAKETLEKVPMPESNLRCACFYHAQRLMRSGMPVQLVPEAKVLHEKQPIIRERTRQGYDTIAACWEDSELPEARWLRLGIFSLPLFYGMNVALDWKRIWIGRKDLDLAIWQAILALPFFPLLRLFDVGGMLRALVLGKQSAAWGGFLVKRRSLE